MSFAVRYAPDEYLLHGVLWRRFWAWMIDLAIIFVLGCFAWTVLAVFGVLTLGLGFSLMVLLPLIPLAYHILFVASARGATPGQAMLDLAVRQEEGLGPPDLFQAILFTLGLWLTFAIFSPLLLLALITDRHRALHDMVAGVIVVRKRALTLAPGFVNTRGGSPYA